MRARAVRRRKCHQASNSGCKTGQTAFRASPSILLSGDEEPEFPEVFFCSERKALRFEKSATTLKTLFFQLMSHES